MVIYINTYGYIQIHNLLALSYMFAYMVICMSIYNIIYRSYFFEYIVIHFYIHILLSIVSIQVVIIQNGDHRNNYHGDY